MRFSKETLLVALAAGTFGVAGSADAATVLTGLTDTNVIVPADHGTDATGTPNVALDWGTGSQWDQYGGWPGDGDASGVYQIDGVGDGTETHLIVFTPDAGWNVGLTSLDLNAWAGGGEANVAWSVDGSVSGNLGGGTFTQADDSLGTHAINLSGAGGETVTLSLTQTSGTGSYLAMDNLAFDQAPVPEPGSALLALGGLGAMTMRRKRK